jgi:hypothetical protein
VRFAVTTEGRDNLGLRQLAEAFANRQWISDHYSPEQAEEFVLDQFKRTLAMELELLVVRCTEAQA